MNISKLYIPLELGLAAVSVSIVRRVKFLCLINMGVSKNRDTPKCMVYNGKPYWNGMIWGYPYFRKHPYFVQYSILRCEIWWEMKREKIETLNDISLEVVATIFEMLLAFGWWNMPYTSYNKKWWNSYNQPAKDWWGFLRVLLFCLRDSDSSFCADDEGVTTPRKIKMKPENASLEEEKHLPNHRFYVNLRGY